MDEAQLVDHGRREKKRICIGQPEAAVEVVEHIGEREPMLEHTFRTLFWSSEAILTAPLEESGGRAISSAYQLTELFVFLGSSS